MAAAVLRRRLDRAFSPVAPDPLSCPSYEELRARMAILAYVVGESHEDETIFQLAWKFSPSPDNTAVERAVRDLVGEGLLTIDVGKVQAGPGWTSDPMNP